MRASSLLSLLLLAGCSKGTVPDPYDLGACGGTAERCCAGDTCNDKFQCVAGFCQVIPCGDVGERCCDGDCDVDRTCVDGTCRFTCGGAGQPCCGTQQLCNDPGTYCSGNGRCEEPRRATGAPCNTVADCDGASPVCMTLGSDGVSWPSGYCSSSCDPSHSDWTGRNPDCPGGSGICATSDRVTGICMAGCTEIGGTLPCRPEYACFYCPAAQPCSPICQPAAESQCDPNFATMCGQDQGCVRIGLDQVGACGATCDVFAQDCDQSKGPQGCYLTDDTGQGYCMKQLHPVEDGQTCAYPNNCLPGQTCVGNLGACRPFCGGPSNVPCTNGKQCVDFSTTIKVAVVGVCAG